VLLADYEEELPSALDWLLCTQDAGL
jgi:hypothetical protein